MLTFVFLLPASTDLPPPSHSRPGIQVCRTRVAPRPLCSEQSMHTAGAHSCVEGVGTEHAAAIPPKSSGSRKERSVGWFPINRALSKEYRQSTNAVIAERGVGRGRSRTWSRIKSNSAEHIGDPWCSENSLVLFLELAIGGCARSCFLEDGPCWLSFGGSRLVTPPDRGLCGGWCPAWVEAEHNRPYMPSTIVVVVVRCLLLVFSPPSKESIDASFSVLLGTSANSQLSVLRLFVFLRFVLSFMVSNFLGFDSPFFLAPPSLPSKNETFLLLRARAVAEEGT